LNIASRWHLIKAFSSLNPHRAAPMSIRRLIILVAFAEEGSFAAAAGSVLAP